MRSTLMKLMWRDVMNAGATLDEVPPIKNMNVYLVDFLL